MKNYLMNTYNRKNISFVKGKGVLIANDAKMDVDEMLLCHTQVLLRIDSGKKLQYLTKKDVDRLLDWEPEKYRQSLEN